jgi:hypothetical protein
MYSEIVCGVLGGFIGGILGVLGTLISSYYGPRKMEEWREERQEERIYGPRKKLLKQLLEDQQFSDGRTLETLSRVTGTDERECRRLLIEIGARGVMLKNGIEGWALITRKPLNEQ